MSPLNSADSDDTVLASTVSTLSEAGVSGVVVKLEISPGIVPPER